VKDKMNIIFVTQGIGLRLFWFLMKSIKNQTKLENTGFSVADQYYFEKAVREFPEIESGKYKLLKEWEITGDAGATQLDLEIIEHYEKKLGDATLWNALVTDRRIYHGKNCKLRQDYKSRFNHEQILKIVQKALVDIDAHFDAVQPEAVVALNAVTFCDYLYYLFAKYYNIPYLQLKLTRIENYVSLYTKPFQLSPHIYLKYQEYYKKLNENSDYTDEDIDIAHRFYNKVRNRQLTYEGSVSSYKQAKQKTPRINPSRLLSYLRTWFEYRLSPAYKDNHFPGIITPMLHRKVLMPLRARKTEKKIGGYYLSPDKLMEFSYAFYPMHTEPEVALSVFGRPYQNQIETIRNIAANLPVSWKLVVKDHPIATSTTKKYCPFQT
jgi:hypothetical protein